MNEVIETQEKAASVIAAALESCFVQVPETTLPNGVVVPAFKVGQYFTSIDGAGKAVVFASTVPAVNVTYHAAVQAAADAGFKLLTELQALAIAHDIANQAANWTGGTVGEGSIKQGLRNWTVRGAQSGDYVSSNAGEDRVFVLSNGARIHDAAGHLFGWIFDDVQGDERGLVAKAFAADSPSLTTAPYPSMVRGMGWRPNAGADWSGYALLRGGYWDDGGNAGVFRLHGAHPDDGNDLVGFRCTKP